MTPTARDTTPTALRRTPIVADNATRLPLRLLLAAARLLPHAYFRLSPVTSAANAISPFAMA